MVDFDELRLVVRPPRRQLPRREQLLLHARLVALRLRELLLLQLERVEELLAKRTESSSARA